MYILIALSSKETADIKEKLPLRLTAPALDSEAVELFFGKKALAGIAVVLSA